MWMCDGGGGVWGSEGLFKIFLSLGHVQLYRQAWLQLSSHNIAPADTYWLAPHWELGN